MPYTFQNKHIWITGSTSGIGLALSNELLSRGAKLILSGRNESMLREIGKKHTDRVLKLPFDVRDFEAYKKASQWIEEKWGYLDIVILNAGIVHYRNKDEFNHLVFENLIQSNFYSIVYGIEVSLPLLKKSSKPHIVAMSSQISFLGLPRIEAYSASKAAIRSMMEGLTASFYNQILVTTIYPGLIDTPLINGRKHRKPFLKSPEEAAKIIVNGIAKEKTQIRFPWQVSFLMWVARLLPHRWLMAITSKLMPKL